MSSSIDLGGLDEPASGGKREDPQCPVGSETRPRAAATSDVGDDDSSSNADPLKVLQDGDDEEGDEDEEPSGPSKSAASTMDHGGTATTVSPQCQDGKTATTSVDDDAPNVVIPPPPSAESQECAPRRQQPQRVPGYIYALREVVGGCSVSDHTTGIIGEANLGNPEEKLNEDEEESSQPCSDPRETPRVVTSTAVRTTEEVYRQLEARTAGTVLCPSCQTTADLTLRPRPRAYDNDDDLGVNDDGLDDFDRLEKTSGESFDVFRASSLAADEDSGTSSLFIAAVSASSIQRKMGGHPSTCCPIALDGVVGAGRRSRKKKKKKKKKLTNLPSRMLRSARKRWRRIRKGKNGDSTRGKGKENSILPSSSSDSSDGEQPKMVIRNGIIDWEDSRLDGCGAVSSSSTFVAYSATTTVTAHTSNKKKCGGNTKLLMSSENHHPVAVSPATLGATIFGDVAVIHNSIRPIDQIVCVDRSLGIYVSESGLSASDCLNIINVSESTATSRGGWSSYTYAKQTLGCRENDRLAFVCARPVMTACATIRRHLTGVGEEEDDDEEETGDGDREDIQGDTNTSDDGDTQKQQRCDADDEDSDNFVASAGNGTSNDGVDTASSTKKTKAKELVLDVREPHVVKYDTTRTERQKLDMHTDKSEWTFLIALSEGRGEDYHAGGTYFQALGCTVHLQRSQMLIFRGKLRHCGVSIRSGCRYLLVGFLVPHAGTAA